jgi:hypothetical protein
MKLKPKFCFVQLNRYGLAIFIVAEMDAPGPSTKCRARQYKAPPKKLTTEDH